MLDGRFDQHFLEIFARGPDGLDCGNRNPGLMAIVLAIALVFSGLTVLILATTV